MAYTKSILVTGAPRSGTSWVGRMISQAPRVRYVHEPFNISSIPCRCGVNFKYWFHYLSPENCHDFEDHLKHTIFPAYNLIGFLNSLTTTVQTKRIRTLSKYMQSHISHRVVVKDPIAIFSAETLVHLFDMDVVVIIRHPAAVVNSYKSLNWRHPFLHFLNQPELMEQFPVPFRSEIEDFAKNEYDIVDQVALLWKLIHYIIIKYRETHSDWIIIRYEDLLADPIEGYRRIFEQLQLSFSKSIHSEIASYFHTEQTVDTTDPYAIKQNPDQVAYKWKKALSPSEIDRVRKRVEDVSSIFFTDKEW